MRTLVVSHAYAAPINRQKLYALAKAPGLEVSALVPEVWREGDRLYRTEGGEESGCRIFTGKAAFPGRVTGHFYLTGYLRALRAVRPDVVHLEEEPWSAAALQTMILQRFLRPRPRLVLFSFELLDLRLPRYYAAIERAALRRADVLIAAGAAQRARLLRQGADAGKIVLLPQFGLDADLFRPAGAAEKPPVFTIGFIGRLVRQKGVDVLIRACASLGGEWRLLLVGDGPEREKLERLAADSGIKDRVTFAGWVDHLEVPDYIRKMSALVLPARSTAASTEQFGHVLIEAMSAGVAAVGSDSGEIPRVIGDAGVVFPEEDAEALAGALRRIRDDAGLRESLIAKGKQRVAERYTWEVIVRETRAIYERALGAGAAGERVS